MQKTRTASLHTFFRTFMLVPCEDIGFNSCGRAASGDDAALRFFLRSGINKFKKTKNLWSAPHFAANEYSFSFLLYRSTVSSLKYFDRGHPDILLHLLLDGVPLSERDIWGRTPLHISVEAKTYTCANFLLQVTVCF